MDRIPPEDSPPCCVVLVEDDPGLRGRLTELLSEQDDFVFLGAFADGGSALTADLSEVAIAMVDLGLPDMPGVELIRALRSQWPEMDVMVHSVSGDRKTVFEAIVAGASSYVLKGLGERDLLDALREFRAGGAPMTPRIARLVIRTFQQQNTVADRYTLTGREHQVITLLEDGHTYKEIGRELHVSHHTVHTHIKRIYEKLHAHTKAEALTKARLRGILK